MYKIQSIIKKTIFITITSVSIVSILLGVFVSNAKLFGMDAPNPANLKYQEQICTLPSKSGNWIETCNLNKFDPIDGQLRRVRIKLVAQIKSDIGVENLDSTPGNIIVQAAGKITIRDLVSNTNLLSIDESVTRSYNLPAFDGVDDRAGISGVTEVDVLGLEKTEISTYDLNTVASSSVVNGFLKTAGPGTPDKDVQVVTTANMSGTANVQAKITTQAIVKQVIFTYEYFQANVGITTTHSPVVFQENSTGDIIYKVSNNDNEATTAPLTFVTTLPSYLTFVSNTNPNWSCTGLVTISCTSTTSIPVGGSNDIILKVNTGTGTPNTYTNNVKLSYGVGEYDLLDNEFNHPIPFNHDPVAQNCDTGSHQQGKNVILINSKNPCLNGTDTDIHLITDKVVKYEIKTLPNLAHGKLTDGVNDINLGQDVTTILNKLTFVPNPNFIGTFEFEYTVYDTFDKFDKTNATVKGLFTENDLGIDKQSPAPKEFNVGTEFEYIIKASNLKPIKIEAPEFLVEDILPSQLDFVSSSIVGTPILPFPCTFTSPKLTCKRLGLMQANEIVEFKVRVKIKDQASGTVKNTATIRSDALEVNFNNNTDDDDIKINWPPVAIDCLLGQFQQGQTIDLSNKIPVCLNGTDPDLDDSVVKYIITTLPLLTTGKLTLNGNDVTLSQILTPADRNKILFIPLPNYSGNISFTYTVEDTKGLRDVTPATVTAEFYPNDILPKKKLKTGETIFVPGTIKTYDLEVVNNKATPVTGKIVMIDTLPASLTYVSHIAPSGWNCVFSLKELKCEINRTFNANEVMSFTITVKVADIVTPIVLNTFKVIPEFAQDTINDEVKVENPGNNPPVAVDCDLGIGKVNTNIVIKDIKANCLQGSDPDLNDSISKFIIKSLPNPATGKLTYNNLDVGLEQVIPLSKENDIIFVPKNGYVGEYIFNYTVEDTKGLSDLTPARVIGKSLPEDLSITKNATVDAIELNKNFDYEFVITNKGANTMLRGLSFSDPLPIGMNYVSTNSIDWDCIYNNTTRIVDCIIKKDLLAKESSKVLMTVRLDQSYQNNNITNKVDLVCLDIEITCDNNKDQKTTPIVEYDIAVLKNHEGEFKIGQLGKYKFTISNTTKYDLTDVVTLEDTLPTGLTIESYSTNNPDWVCINKNTSQLECKNTKGLKAMQSDTISLNVMIGENTDQEITNTVTVNTPTKEKDYNNNKSPDTVKTIRDLPPLIRTGGSSLGYTILILSFFFGLYRTVKFLKKENL